MELSLLICSGSVVREVFSRYRLETWQIIGVEVWKWQFRSHSAVEATGMTVLSDLGRQQSVCVCIYLCQKRVRNPLCQIIFPNIIVFINSFLNICTYLIGLDEGNLQYFFAFLILNTKTSEKQLYSNIRFTVRMLSWYGFILLSHFR